MGIIMSLKHPLVWSVIVSFCIASLLMPLLRRLGLAFGITAARAGEQSPTMVPVLGGPAIVAGFVLAAAYVGGGGPLGWRWRLCSCAWPEWSMTQSHSRQHRNLPRK